jgi:hypothetical protein
MALRSVHLKILENYGESVQLIVDIDGESGFKLTKKGIQFGKAADLGVLDSAETVCSVIKNGVALGTKLAILGGFSFRNQNTNAEDFE